MRDVYQAFEDKKCRATIFRDAVFLKLSAVERERLKIISKMLVLPNQTITVNNRLISDTNKLADFFTSHEGAMISSGILQRYSRKKEYFETAPLVEYKGVETILENVVWGW